MLLLRSKHCVIYICMHCADSRSIGVFNSNRVFVVVVLFAAAAAAAAVVCLLGNRDRCLSFPCLAFVNAESDHCVLPR